jgi:hypothetical protein
VPEVVGGQVHDFTAPFSSSNEVEIVAGTSLPLLFN